MSKPPVPRLGYPPSPNHGELPSANFSRQNGVWQRFVRQSTRQVDQLASDRTLEKLMVLRAFVGRQWFKGRMIDIVPLLPDCTDTS
jgi:hypothetical protein